MSYPRFEPVQDTRQGRHNSETDQVMGVRRVVLERQDDQRTQCANADERNHTQNTKDKG